MKNREYRVLVTLALMASLVVGNIAGTSVNVQAADNKDKSTETKKTSEQTAAQHLQKMRLYM